MAEEPSLSPGAHIGGTVIAAIIAPIILLTIAVLVGGLASIIYIATTLIRPGIIGFFSAILGGVVGTFAARAACDAVLRSYSKKTVAIELGALMLSGIGFELLFLPWDWSRIAPVSQCCAIGYATWQVFWNGEFA